MTTGAPRVSVIMPFFNVERFIEESIESVLTQTFPHWELLLIDDGSTDGSTRIARNYAREFPDRVRYFTHDRRENRGASAARNLGIHHARGEYIALLDADDVWLPHKLEHQVPILDAHPEVGSLYGSTLYWYSWTDAQQDRDEDEIRSPGFPPGTILHPPALLVANLEGRAPVPCTCSILMRRSVVEKVGGFEATFLRLFTDQAFYSKLFLESSVLVTTDCWDKYRRHQDSSSVIARRQGQTDSLRRVYLTWLARYVDKQGYAHPDVQRALQKATWPYRHPGLHRLLQAFLRIPQRVAELYWHEIVPAAFGTGRAILPRSFREWAWSQWQTARARRNASPPPLTPTQPATGEMNYEKRLTGDGLVTVIIIFLNEERFLDEAIKSVFAQTYQHWELLLVDDGSTDDSTRLAQEYAARDPERVRYLDHPGRRNHGMSASRNLGIRHARGEYLALLDADDVWLTRKLERQVSILNQNPEAAMVFGPTLLWRSWTGQPGDAARDFVTRLPVAPERITAGVKILSRILSQRADPVYTCSVLIRRSAVLSVGGFEDQFRGLFEDQVFFSKILHGHSVYVMRECLDRYRQHPDSCCGGVDAAEPHATPAMLEAQLCYLQWFSSYLERKPARLRLRWRLAYELWLHRFPGIGKVRGAVRSASARISSDLVRLAFAVGRRIIPRVIRQRLWRVLMETPRSRDASRRSSGPA